MLWIHAGPHKAASSYVTERLRQNREHLAAQGVLMDGDNNRLANAIAEKNYGLVEDALATLPSSLNRVLLSSSSLDDRILSRTVLGKLQALVERQGFKLGVSYFVRDQQSWLNSVYAHRLRRFRETPDFEQYCEYIMHDSDSWNIAYPSKFRVLSRFPAIATLFLPLSKQVAITDPFLALIEALRRPHGCPRHSRVRRSIVTSGCCGSMPVLTRQPAVMSPSGFVKTGSIWPLRAC